jgi:hypothetical protein
MLKRPLCLTIYGDAPGHHKAATAQIATHREQ